MPEPPHTVCLDNLLICLLVGDHWLDCVDLCTRTHTHTRAHTPMPSSTPLVRARARVCLCVCVCAATLCHFTRHSLSSPLMCVCVCVCMASAVWPVWHVPSC